MTTGTPATPWVQGRPSNINDLANGDRPDVVLGQDSVLPNPDRDGWWNPAAFVPNQPLTFGNSGKGVLRLPNRNNWDFSAFKAFRFTEKYSAQFRFEAFNFTNAVNLTTPNQTVGNRNFGTISGAAQPRILQFGFKFIF